MTARILGPVKAGSADGVPSNDDGASRQTKP